MGDGYSNNLTVVGGKAYLSIKQQAVLNKQPIPGSSFTRNYALTGVNLVSSFMVRQGIFTADIKLPENPTLWPAYWMLYSSTSVYQEIDIFEFYDPNLSGSVCNTYHQHKMTIHGKVGNIKCERGRKFPVNSGYFTDPNDATKPFHSYQCTWTDYKTHFFVDGSWKAYANKYYDGPYFPSSICYKHTGTGSGLPSKSYDCASMSTLSNCILTNPFNNGCSVFNKVDKDAAYPNTNIPMEIRISNAILSPSNFNTLISSWNNYIQVDKEIAVDQVVIWQPINCGATYNLCSKNDFLNASGGSSFLGGSQFNIGNNVGNCTFTHNDPGFPLHLLATNEIGFVGGDIIIDQGSYLRAEIISCNVQGFTQKLPDGSQMPSYAEVSDEEIKTLEEKEMQDFIKNNPELADSLIRLYNRQLYEENLAELSKERTHSVSEADNGSIILFPNPATDLVHVDMVEEDFNDILSMEIINKFGQSFKIERTQHIDLSNFAPGMYQVKFVFSHGFVVVKNVCKQ